MDTVDKPIKKKFRHPDRIALTAESLERLGLWLNQASEEIKGIKLSRADLLNYLISSAGEKLTGTQISEIEKEYFDEIKFHEWAVRELRAARKKGLDTTYSQITSQKQNRPRKQVPKDGLPTMKKTKNSNPELPVAATAPLEQEPIASNKE